MRYNPLCQESGCVHPSLTSSEYCRDHIKEPDDHLQRIIQSLREKSTFINCNFSGLPLENLDLSNKRFLNCQFSRAQLSEVNLNNTEWQLCFLDYAGIKDSTFKNVTMHYTVFSGASLEGCDWGDSDIINCNFNGTKINRCNFSSSDLYFTRFIGARMKEVPMVDCNIKKADFSHTEREGVSFKYSNFEEALFDQQGAAL